MVTADCDVLSADYVDALDQLYSRDPSQQQQPCAAMRSLLPPELPAEPWQRRGDLDVVATLHGKSLAARLVDLAANITPAGRQLALAAFELLALCCSRADLAASEAAQELASNSSGLAAAVLAQWAEIKDKGWQRDDAMPEYLLRCVAGLAAHQACGPKWLRVTVDVALSALQMSQDSGQLLAALQLLYSLRPFWQPTPSCDQVAPLAIRLLANASLSMQVHAAAAALLAKCWLQQYRDIMPNPLPGDNKFMWGLDLQQLTALANAAPCGSDLELFLIRSFLLSVADGSVGKIKVWPTWVVARLVARVRHAPQLGYPSAYHEAMGLLRLLQLVMDDQLGDNGLEPSLKESVIAAGLLPALASWVAAGHAWSSTTPARQQGTWQWHFCTPHGPVVTLKPWIRQPCSSSQNAARIGAMHTGRRSSTQPKAAVLLLQQWRLCMAWRTPLR